MNSFLVRIENLKMIENNEISNRANDDRMRQEVNTRILTGISCNTRLVAKRRDKPRNSLTDEARIKQNRNAVI